MRLESWLVLNTKMLFNIKRHLLMNPVAHYGKFHFNLILISSIFSLVMEYADNGDVF